MAQDPQLIAYLSIGQPNTGGDKIGPGFVPHTPESAAEVAHDAAEYTRPYTLDNVAYCIDGRSIIQLGDVTDPGQLKDIITPRLPGGTFLAATKAVVGANAEVVREAKNFDQAYDIVAGVLGRTGYVDAGHEACGAEAKMVKSVEEQVPADVAFATLQAVDVAKPGDEARFAAMHAHKQALVANGFFKGYDPAAHRQRVIANSPQHFAKLQTAADVTHGHHEGGAYLLSNGQGLATNEFNDATGGQLFAYTHGYAVRLSEVLGGSPEERRRIELGFGADLLDVSNQLIARPEGNPGDANFHPGMPVFRGQYALV